MAFENKVIISNYFFPLSYSLTATNNNLFSGMAVNCQRSSKMSENQRTFANNPLTIVAASVSITSDF